jgi:hydroxyacylglutathione hydrolase
MEADAYLQHASVSLFCQKYLVAFGGCAVTEANVLSFVNAVVFSHWDHTGGNMDLKTDGVTICGPAAEKSKIPGIDVELKSGDEVVFGSTKAQIMDVGGHTLGHIAYYFPDAQKVFVGDSLFALGCGKMFEGTAEQFWTSLQGLRALPDETMVYW